MIACFHPAKDSMQMWGANQNFRLSFFLAIQANLSVVNSLCRWFSTQACRWDRWSTHPSSSLHQLITKWTFEISAPLFPINKAWVGTRLRTHQTIRTGSVGYRSKGKIDTRFLTGKNAQRVWFTVQSAVAVCTRWLKIVLLHYLPLPYILFTRAADHIFYLYTL